MKAMVFGAALMAACLGWAAKETPGFVRVDWSEAEGEKWTIEGLADRETGRPMAKDTVFAICSNTKPITSVLVLTFVEEGLINLDDPLAKYFPGFADITYKGQKPKSPITLRQLITHMSGLPYGAAAKGRNADMTSYLEMVDIALKQGLRSESGVAYQYCGLGFQVIGAVLEKVTGRKVTDLMKERIFDPLEMTEATFYPDEKLLARVAWPYYYPPKGGAPVRYGFENRWTVPLNNPARTALLSGGLFCTAGDYLKFSQMLARKGLGLNGKRILTEQTFDTYLATRQTPTDDKVNASFDIHFGKDNLSGSKGGLFATGASWNWGNRSCSLNFRAKSPYAPKGMKSELDASGFGGARTTFVVTEKKVEGERASCLVANNDDRHGVALVKLVVNGKVVATKKVGLAIGESKRVAFVQKVESTDKVEFKVR
ncbi:MAG: beta-lactamase family protein [Kiritimatiellae bacterium]|nr:beta-lactamase family protein [Kiritimatiellia bacterium]